MLRTAGTAQVSFTRFRKSFASIRTFLAMSGSWSFSNIISFEAISAASLGLKPRITNPLARVTKLSGARDATVRCVAQSWLELGRGESVVSVLCFRIAKKRRKRKGPVARGTGPASQVFIRHPHEHSCHSNFPGWTSFRVVSVADNTPSRGCGSERQHGRDARAFANWASGAAMHRKITRQSRWNLRRASDKAIPNQAPEIGGRRRDWMASIPRG